MKFPEKLYFGLKMLDKGKPNIKLFQFQNSEKYNIGYEKIKTGARIIWIVKNTKREAEKRLLEWLRFYELV